MNLNLHCEQIIEIIDELNAECLEKRGFSVLNDQMKPY